jgi:MSHA biogenesis protein MshP
VKCRAAESGFGLVSALFLLVVLSSAAAFMVNLTGIERTTVNFAIQGAHAYQAARSGVEWGIWQLENNGTCFADTDLNLTESGDRDYARRRLQVTISDAP